MLSYPPPPEPRWPQAAGASPPSLYAHFGNKEGLIAAALADGSLIAGRFNDRLLGAALLTGLPGADTVDTDAVAAAWSAVSVN